VDGVRQETAPINSPERGLRQKAMDLFQGNNCNPGEMVVKRANSRKRERSDSISSIKSNLTHVTPPKVSPTEPDASGNVGE